MATNIHPSAAARLLIISIALALTSCGGGDSAAPVAGADAPPNPAVRIEIDRASATFTAAGQSIQLAPRSFDTDGVPTAAPVTWVSSRPEQIAVDAGGKVTAVTPIGSALVYAEANGVRTPSVFVATIELRAGTLALRDADVVRVGPAIAAPTAGGRPLQDVWLRGISLPATGSIVVAIESAGASGRVVESVAEGSEVRVRIEAAPLHEVLARYDFDFTFDLAEAPQIYDNVPLGTSAKAQSTGRTAGWARAQAQTTDVNVKIPESKKSPFSCEASISANVASTDVSATLTGRPRMEVIAQKFFPSDPPDRTRVALVGSLTLETDVTFEIAPGLEAEGSCELIGPKIPVGGHPIINKVIGPVIPLGIGAKIKGKMDLANFAATFKGSAIANFEMGVDCVAAAPCQILHAVSGDSKFETKTRSSSILDGLRAEVELSLYLISGFYVEPALGDGFKVIKATLGPKQKFDLGSNRRQWNEVPYASNYDLKLQAKAGPGGDVKKAIEWVADRTNVSVDFKLDASKDISESPRGAFTADKSNALPDFDTVNLTIDLDPKSVEYFLLGYNVASVEIYRRKQNEDEFTHVRSIEPSELGQTRFQWAWKPTNQDLGRNEFVAFVASNMPLADHELEVKDDSRLTVNVGCAQAPAAGAMMVRALDANLCEGVWKGGGSAVTPVADATYDVLWRRDKTYVGNPGDVAFRPTGTSRVNWKVWTSIGCTVSPDSYSRFRPGDVLVVNTLSRPATYTVVLGIVERLTITCPSGGFTADQAFTMLIDSGSVSADDTTIAKTVSGPGGSHEYVFKLESAPASSAALRN